MDRKSELEKLFKEHDEEVLTIVRPLIDELVFVEAQLAELRTKPFIKYHPDDPSLQKATDASRLYHKFLAQHKDIIRILCFQLHKVGVTDVQLSPLRDYFSGMETR